MAALFSLLRAYDVVLMPDGGFYAPPFFFVGTLRDWLRYARISFPLPYRRREIKTGQSAFIAGGLTNGSAMSACSCPPTDFVEFTDCALPYDLQIVPH